MKKTVIAVVILHYNDFDMTKNYIENLRTLEWAGISHKFIIVDNNSPDGSGIILKEYYENDKDVIVMLLNENIGFARGNNKGILFARNELKAELIVVSNNDIDVKSINFPKLILEEYEKSNFAVCGPDIYSLSKQMHQNPMRKEPMNLEQVRNKIRKINYIVPILEVLDKTKLYDICRKIKNKFSNKNVSNSEYYLKYLENCTLHGAFFVLSKKYMDEYDDGLFEGTFLYMEEDILAYRCKIKKMKMVYNPVIQVIHYDGVSSLKIARNRCRKFIREMKETKKSCVSFIEYIEECTAQEKNEE